MTKEELKERCNSEFESIDRIVNELSFLVSHQKSEYTIVEVAAISAFVLNVYTGVENILKQMLLFDGLDVSDSPTWHENVLKKSAEIGILPPDLLQALSRYLSFRTIFVYSYIFNIKWEELKVLVDAIRDVIGRFKTEVGEYIQTI
ncbi:MAG: hypothetical protein HY752_01705 [Nitrospirae bacterium]|nr:hypothetical protein [Nitrospirota bacterium]